MSLKPELHLTRTHGDTGFHLPDGTHVHPHIQMTRTERTPYSSLRVVSIHGVPRYVSVSCFNNNKKEYRSLTNEHWEKLVPAIQNIFHVSITSSRGPGGMTNLASNDKKEVTIPLSDRTAPITYTSFNQEEEIKLRPEEMSAFTGGHTIPQLKHDFMKDLRIAFRHPQERHHTFIDTLPHESKVSREETLATQERYHQNVIEQALELGAPIHADVQEKIRHSDRFALSNETFFRLIQQSKKDDTDILPVIDATNFMPPPTPGRITPPDHTMSPQVTAAFSTAEMKALLENDSEYLYIPLKARRMKKDGSFENHDQAISLYVDKASRAIYVYNPNGHSIREYPHLMAFIEGYKAAQFPNPEGTATEPKVQIIAPVCTKHQGYKPFPGSRKKSLIDPKTGYKTLPSEHYNGLRYQLRFFEEMSKAKASATAATSPGLAKQQAFSTFLANEFNREQIEMHYAHLADEKIRSINYHYERAHSFGI